jgi:subtilisin family serine protease
MNHLLVGGFAMRRSLHLVGCVVLLAVLTLSGQSLAQDIAVSQQIHHVSATLDKAPDAGKPGPATVTREIDGQTYLELFLEGNVSEADLKAKGVIIESRLPNGMMTANVPEAMFSEVASLPGMKRITASYMCHPDLNYSTTTTLAKPNYWTNPSPPAFSGQAGAGVVVGDVNNGIDYKHDDFKNPDGTTRILYLWDQIDTTTPHPSGFTYGREFTAADMNANTPTVRDGADGHGSHCMGIAAGDGSATGN